MIHSTGYAAHSPKEALKLYEFERREPAENEVLIDIHYCGICHADIHQCKNEYGNTVYPLVPGHEIVGRIRAVGPKASRFKINELVGVGYFIDSCRHCSNCEEGDEQYCDRGITPTQNGVLADGNVTKGGYSDCIVVNENYVLKIAETLRTEEVAPLLCAGITAYSPLKHWKVGRGHKVAILGLGGVGHMAVRFAAAFGAEVTVISNSPKKKVSAALLGATNFIVHTDMDLMKQHRSSFDFIIDTVSAKHDYNVYLGLLKKGGTMVLLGVPPEAPQLAAYQLIAKRRNISGSFTGGIKETQEMLDYCADNNITAVVELIKPQNINEAFERTLKGDVRYRFVIDMKELKNKL